MLSRYGISKEEVKKRKGTKGESQASVDFTQLYKQAEILDAGEAFYTRIILDLGSELNSSDQRKLGQIKAFIQTPKELTDSLISYNEDLMKSLRINHPQFFDENSHNNPTKYKNTVDFIVTKYNNCIAQNADIQSEFEKVATLCEIKKIKYGAVYKEIGHQLVKNSPPSIKQLNHASNYVKEKKGNYK